MGELLSFKNETPAFQNNNSTNNIKEKSGLENKTKILKIKNKLFLISIFIPS